MLQLVGSAPFDFYHEIRNLFACYCFSPKDAAVNNERLLRNHHHLPQLGGSKPGVAKLLPRFQHLQPPEPQLPQHRPDQLHQQAADGAGERVSLQQIPNQSQTDRNRVGSATQRDASQDLVPEQADEAEEADEGGPDTAGADTQRGEQQQLAEVVEHGARGFRGGQQREQSRIELNRFGGCVK